MRRADLGDMDLEVGVVPHERSGGTRMVEVDVAEEEMPDVGQGDAAVRQAFLERGNRACRAAVEEGEAVAGLEEIAADDAVRAEVVEVD